MTCCELWNPRRTSPLQHGEQQVLPINARQWSINCIPFPCKNYQPQRRALSSRSGPAQSPFSTFNTSLPGRVPFQPISPVERSFGYCRISRADKVGVGFVALCPERTMAHGGGIIRNRWFLDRNGRGDESKGWQEPRGSGGEKERGRERGIERGGRETKGKLCRLEDTIRQIHICIFLLPIDSSARSLPFCLLPSSALGVGARLTSSPRIGARRVLCPDTFRDPPDSPPFMVKEERKQEAREGASSRLSRDEVRESRAKFNCHSE